MKNILSRKKIFQIFPFLITIAYTIGILIFPAEVSQSVIDSLKLCVFSVIPSLFPFLISVNMITNMHYFDFFGKALYKMMPRLFSVNGVFSSSLLLGLIGGYPMGGVIIALLYKSNACRKEEAERALAFCNNCGPAFILGIVGNSIFSSTRTGIYLYAIHISSALITGIIFRFFSPVSQQNSYFERKKEIENVSFSKCFTTSISSALKSSLQISAYIIFFSVFITLLVQSEILLPLSALISSISGIPQKATAAFLYGLFEMTSGIFSLSAVAETELTFALSSFLLGWGGFSVHFQTRSMFSDCNISTKQYYIGKLLHGTISFILAGVTAIIIF